MKNLISQGYPIFPQKPVETGESWSRPQTARLPYQSLEWKLSCNYTYAGPQTLEQPQDQDRERVVELIEVDCQVAINPGESTPDQPAVLIQIPRQAGKGTIIFDLEAGHPVSSELTQDLVLNITPSGAETVTTSVVSTVKTSFGIVPDQPDEPVASAATD